MIKRGEIYFIEPSNREYGSEMKGGRPAVIVSNDAYNAHSGVVEIVYMTASPKRDYSTHVPINSALLPSTLICEQITTVSVERVGRRIGELTAEEVEAMNEALALSLGLDPVGDMEINFQGGTLELIDEEDEAKDLERLRAEALLYNELYSELLDKVLAKGAGK